MLCLVLALAVKTMSNHTNHLFDAPVDGAFKALTRRSCVTSTSRTDTSNSRSSPNVSD